MIQFKLKNPPSINLNWWPKTQKQWAPVLLEQQKPFWKQERDPTTKEPWAKLSADYKPWKDKKYPGQPILRATGRMQDTAKILPGSNGGFKAQTASYGAYQQFGTSKMPARPWLGIPPSSLASLGVIAFKNIFFSKNRK
jgi:phage gpG-like protein